MSNDLVAVLGARLDQFQADLNQAGDMADQTISRIEGAFADLNPSFGGLATLGLSIGGAVAAVTGLLTVLQKVNSELAQIATAAQYLNTSTDNVQKLQYVGTTQGLGGDQSLQDLQNVGRLLADANVNENSLTKLLKANNQAYKDRDGDLISINQLLAIGADLVQNAGSYADKVEIAKMLGLTQQWVPALQQGAAGFQKIADSASDAGAIIDKETIAKAADFDAAWKRSSAQLAAQFKSATADVASYLDDLISKAQNFLAQYNAANGLAAGSGQSKFDRYADASQVLANDETGRPQDLDQVTRVLNNAKASGADSGIIAWLEQVQAKAQAVADSLTAAAQAQSKLDYPNGVPVPAARPASADDNDNPTVLPKHDTSKDAFDRAEDQTRKRTADLQAETEAVGENTAAKTQNKAIADLQSAAQRAGITLDDEQKQKILELAAAEGQAAQALAERNQRLQQNNALLQAAGDQAISIVDGLRTGSLTAAQAVNQLTNSLITAIERAELLGTGPLAGILGTSAQAGSGGTGGLLGALFGFQAAPGTSVAGAINGAVGPTSVNGAPLVLPGFADGTDSAPGGPAWVGENGPEVLNVPKGSQVIPNDVMRGMGGGGNVTVNLVEDSSRAGQVQQSSGGNGMNITAFVDAITAKNASTPGSATNFALATRGALARRS